MAYDYSEAGYSPETVKYLDDLVAQRQALSDKYGEGIALNNPDYMYSRYVQDEGGADESYKVYTPEEDIRRIMASGQDASEIFDPGYNVQSFGGSRNPNQFDFVRLGAGKTYTYTDNNTGETYTASTPEQVQALTQLAKSQSGAGNNSASWSIKDSSGKEVASDTSYTPSLLKQTGQTISDLAVEYGIPMLLTAGVVNPALLAAAGIPAQGALATALGTGLSAGTQAAVAGGGAALGKLLKTGDLEKSLLTGAMAGAGSYGLNVSGLGNAIGGVTNDALSGVGIDLPPELFGGSYGASTGGVSNVGGVEQVLVSPGAFYPGSPVGSLAGVLPAQLATSNAGAYPQENVTVSAKRTPVTSGVLPNIVAPVAANALTNLGGYDVPAAQRPVEEVTQTAEKQTIDPESGLPHVPFTIPDYSYAMEPMDTPYQQPKEKSALEKYLNYASLGLTGAGLLSKAFGSGTGGNKTPGAGGMGTFTPAKLPDIFSAKLPGVGTGVGGAGTATPYGATDPGAGGQNLSPEDWYKYGYGPEKSFFKNVPGRPIGMAKGGSTNRFAVRGPGTGRSDDIPANLSDGEYVVDAETVALLGDGSSKAGADRLDRFRVNVRKHKGKSLAAGRFSVAAKRPEVYLKGRT